MRTHTLKIQINDDGTVSLIVETLNEIGKIIIDRNLRLTFKKESLEEDENNNE